MECPMNAKPWLPVIATVLVGSHLIAARAAQMRARVRNHGRFGNDREPVDIQIGVAQSTRLWSSATTRMICYVEEFAMAAIIGFFVVGMIGILGGW
jgi:hypothetical protein